MGEVGELSDQLWTGAMPIEDHFPFKEHDAIELIQSDVLFYYGFSNVTAFNTGAGLVLVDVGSHHNQQRVHDEIRKWTSAPLHTAIYTHGHIDHCFGVPLFAADGQSHQELPRVVAHANVVERFRRYTASAGHNAHINAKQWGKYYPWPTNYRYPDLTYDDRLMLSIGGMDFELRHGRGETDDATWVWAPDSRVLCTGDLFTWCAPNAGNPQKVQRYAGDWAQALREMAALDARVLAPGHGPLLYGEARIRQALTESALYLEDLLDQVLALMNRGATLDEVLQGVRFNEDLHTRPHLHPIYDHPEFIVRNIWRYYGGWYDQDPAHLLPPPRTQLASEVVNLSGGLDALSKRARELALAGEMRLAAQLVEWAVAVAPSDPDILNMRAEFFDSWAASRGDYMARHILRAVARESRVKADGDR